MTIEEMACEVYEIWTVEFELGDRIDDRCEELFPNLSADEFEAVVERAYEIADDHLYYLAFG